MRIKLLTLQYSPLLGTIDDRPLLDFVRDKHVLAVRDHFFTVHDVPHVCCVVCYQEARIEPPAARHPDPAKATPNHDGPRPHPAADLGDPDRALFQTLREWRASRARRDGVPAYVIFHDRELLAIVRARPTSKNALSQLDGIGPAKVERFGGELLPLLAKETPAPRTTAIDPVGEPAPQPPPSTPAMEP